MQTPALQAQVTLSKAPVAEPPGHAKNEELHRDSSSVSKSLRYQNDPWGLVDFSSPYSDGTSAHLPVPPSLCLGLARAGPALCQIARVNIRVSVSIIKCFLSLREYITQLLNYPQGCRLADTVFLFPRDGRGGGALVWMGTGFQGPFQVTCSSSRSSHPIAGTWVPD